DGEGALVALARRTTSDSLVAREVSVELVAHRLRRLEALVRILLEALHGDRRELGRDARRLLEERRRRLEEDLLQDRLDRGRLEGRVPGEDPVEDRSERVDVGARPLLR